MLTGIDFWTDYRPQPDGSMKPVEWVKFRAIGDDKTEAVHRVKDIIPPVGATENNPSHAAMIWRWNILGPKYNAWKKGEELPEEGTPLAAWSAISPEMSKALKAIEIYTVEQVAAIGDSVTEKLRFPNARKLPELAKAFLKGTSKAAAAKEIADLKEQLAAMTELMEDMQKVDAA